MTLAGTPLLPDDAALVDGTPNVDGVGFALEQALPSEQAGSARRASSPFPGIVEIRDFVLIPGIRVTGSL